MATTHLLQITQLGLPQPSPPLPPAPIPRVESLCSAGRGGSWRSGNSMVFFFQRLIWNVVDRSPGSEASEIEGPLWL